MKVYTFDPPEGRLKLNQYLTDPMDKKHCFKSLIDAFTWLLSQNPYCLNDFQYFIIEVSFGSFSFNDKNQLSTDTIQYLVVKQFSKEEINKYLLLL